MTKIDIKVLKKELDKVLALGETELMIEGEWENDNGVIPSLETILKEHGKDVFFR